LDFVGYCSGGCTTKETKKNQATQGLLFK